MNSIEHARQLTREQRAVLARIEQICEYWDIAPAELRRTSRGPKPDTAQAVNTQPVVKYRHPVSGETWDGEGLQPEWLRHALLKEGYRVAELRP